MPINVLGHNRICIAKNATYRANCNLVWLMLLIITQIWWMELSTVCWRCRCSGGTVMRQQNTKVCAWLGTCCATEGRGYLSNGWGEKKGKWYISQKIILQTFFLNSLLYIFPALSSQGVGGGGRGPWLAATSPALRSDVQGEGHTAQVAVSWWTINDALPVQFALHLEVSVVLHPGKTHRHHRGGVVYLWRRHDSCQRFMSLIAHWKLSWLATLTCLSFP